MRASFLRLLPAALLLTASAGCIPNVSWLPDSSGFVYAGGPKFEQVIFYDVAKGKPRVLAANVKGTGIGCAPVVSSDGKRVAVVEVMEDKKTLEVVVYDLDGKELHRSKPLELQETSGRPAAFWVPGQERLLLDDSRIMGFYDLKTGRFSMHETWGSFVSFIGGNPIRPDGKGFLAIKASEKEGKSEGLLFVDWDGKETRIESKTKGLFETDDPLGGGAKQLAYWPTPLRWDGDVAVIGMSDARVTIDAKKLTAVKEDVTPELSADKKWIHDQVRLAGGAVVRAVELGPAHPKETAPNDPKPVMRIEVLKPDDKEAKKIMNDAEFAMIDLSPDGKMAVVQGWNLSLSKARLFLIDAKGDVAADIDATQSP